MPLLLRVADVSCLSQEDIRSCDGSSSSTPSEASPRQRLLTRRTQTLVLLQLTAMFSESRKHMLAAKLSHGALIVIAKELLQEAKPMLAEDQQLSWAQWLAREEAVRAVWAACEC
jgi:hypothetical protein